jgi:DNA topoisomerase-1
MHERDVANHINILLKLSGDKLFQYIDETGNIKKVSDGDLNNYIQTYMGTEFTIKDFRTYAANYYFIKALLDETKLHGNNTKKNIINAIKVSAKQLGHTKNVSKKAYVMSFSVNLYLEHPEFFVTRKYENIDKVLLEILKLYKKSI